MLRTNIFIPFINYLLWMVFVHKLFVLIALNTIAIRKASGRQSSSYNFVFLKLNFCGIVKFDVLYLNKWLLFFKFLSWNSGIEAVDHTFTFFISGTVGLLRFRDTFGLSGWLMCVWRYGFRVDSGTVFQCDLDEDK